MEMWRALCCAVIEVAFYGFLVIVSIVATVFILNNVSYILSANGTMLNQLNRYRRIVSLEAFQNVVANIHAVGTGFENTSVVSKALAKEDGFNMERYGNTLAISSTYGPNTYQVS